MCGIFGIISTEKKALGETFKGLKHLEYRGYDSAGIATLSGEGLFWEKKAGKVENLKSFISPSNECSLAIGHTRWATHGKATEVNAHPHTDETADMALVHNGIVENHAVLRKMLWDQGVEFASETDTEVIVQLVARFYEGNLARALQKATEKMEGFWAIALIDKRHPDEIVVATRGMPLAIAFSEGEALIASDPHAFCRNDLDVYFLQDSDIATVNREEIIFLDQEKRKPSRLHFSEQAMGRAGFDHYMLKEIYEQPQALQSALSSRFLLEPALADLEIGLTDEELKEINQVLFIGCGSAWHAGLVGASLFEELAQIPSRAEIASEFRYRTPVITSDTLVIAISQSGETIDTLAATRLAKEKGAKVIAICNVAQSTLAREADHLLLQRAGPEISVCSTKAFTSQLCLVTLLAFHLARLGQLSQNQGRAILKELLQLPRYVEDLLKRKDEIEALAVKYAAFESFFFLGRHYMYPTALEGALKLKEISYLHASGYPAGELKHGPIALIEENSATIGLCGNVQTLEKMASNLEEVKARGGSIFMIAPEEGKELLASISEDLFLLPDLPDILSPIPYSVVCQLFSYFLAKEKGTEIDQPRNLAKSVTVE